MSEPTRPLLRYHGGKWRLAPKIISLFPPHRVYVEPFGGAASILIRKSRSYAEIYNDLSDEVVNLFRVLRDDAMAERLLRELDMTPFARREFEGAYQIFDAPVDRARALIIRSLMGFGSNGHNIRVKTGFRSNSKRSGTTPAHDWPSYREALPDIIARLRGIVIESQDAVACMQKHDSDETLHYVDPPYVLATRSLGPKRSMHRTICYDHELTDDDHVALVAALRGLKGSVIVSGYSHAIYDDGLSGWRRLKIYALADGALPREEIIWINPRADALHERTPDIFGNVS